MQAVQQAMQIDSAPSWDADLAALEALSSVQLPGGGGVQLPGGGGMQLPGSSVQLPMLPGMAAPGTLAVPGMSGYRQAAQQLAPVWMPMQQPQQQLPPLAGLLSAACAPAKNQGGKGSGSHCQACRYLAANDEGVWPNVHTSHPLTNGVCPNASAWAAQQQKPGFAALLSKKQKDWKRWKQQQQLQQQQ